MLRILHTKDFKKSLKRLQKSGKFNTTTKKKLIDAIDALVTGSKLPESYKDHALKGEFKDKRECHIRGDLLLVYNLKQDVLVLVLIDIGTHSQIFG